MLDTQEMAGSRVGSRDAPDSDRQHDQKQNTRPGERDMLMNSLVHLRSLPDGISYVTEVWHGQPLGPKDHILSAGISWIALSPNCVPVTV
jgi:hypothetical protein